jgi:hypothetical protein
LLDEALAVADYADSYAEFFPKVYLQPLAVYFEYD